MATLCNCGGVKRDGRCVRCGATPRNAQSVNHAMYNDRRWRKFSRAFLAENPLCAECQRQGRATPADVTDHVEPHRGDEEKFWSGPFQPLCGPCHSVKTRRGE